jgi:hypothetical protein
MSGAGIQNCMMNSGGGGKSDIREIHLTQRVAEQTNYVSRKPSVHIVFKDLIII